MARGYFYRGQSEQFVFYRTPKVLYTEPEYEQLSIPAKALYGILLDRESLSDKSGWVDDLGRIYVYMTNKSICKALHISDKTATKLLKELEEIDLIQRIRQGQGKPTRIYVKNFMDMESIRFLSRKSSDSDVVEASVQGSEELRPNNTEYNNTDFNNNNLILSGMGCDHDTRADYREYFKDRLAIDILKERYPHQDDILEGIEDLILDVVCSNKQKIRVNGEDMPINVVKSRFMKLDSSHVEYVMDSLSETTSQIRNIKQYLIAALYNAPATIGSYYQQMVRHDFAYPSEEMRRKIMEENNYEEV